MPERRVTLRIVTPEPGINDPVLVEVLTPMEAKALRTGAPQTRFEAATVADALSKLAAVLEDTQ